MTVGHGEAARRVEAAPADARQERLWPGVQVTPPVGRVRLGLITNRAAMAIASDAKRFFLGSMFGLASLDDAGAQKWWRPSPGEVWAVNAGRDGRIVVTAEGDGTIRWLRANDGRELLALQVLPNKTDWVLWTPEGFYAATPSAQNVLKWVVNHGPDAAATTLSVSAIPNLYRPDALRLVLDQLETARALGIAEVAAARLSVQTATGSEKPPGAVLHVLAVGIDHFGDKAGALKLDYAVDAQRMQRSMSSNSPPSIDERPLSREAVSRHTGG